MQAETSRERQKWDETRVDQLIELVKKHLMYQSEKEANADWKAIGSSLSGSPASKHAPSSFNSGRLKIELAA